MDERMLLLSSDGETTDILKDNMPIQNYEDYPIHILYFSGSLAGMTKDNEVSVNYIFKDRSGTCSLKWQGSSSLSLSKKNFTIKSTGTLDQTLDIYIKVTENTFANNSLRFAVYDADNGSKLLTGYISNVIGSKIMMARGVPLESNKSKTFTVLIWLQENNQNQDYEQGKTFAGGFDITANQVLYQ